MKQVKYRRIVSHLRTAIDAGRYGPGHRLPSEAALVKRFQVSRPTVIRALRELQSDGLIDRKVGSGTFVRASPPTAPAGRSFGLLVPGLADGEIFEPVCVALAREAHAAGHTLVWGDLAGTTPRDLAASTERLAHEYARCGVAGVFFSPLEFAADKDAVSRRIARALTDADVPVVLLDSDMVEPPARSRYDLVGLDNHAAGHLLADHLMALGSRSVHFLGRPGSAATVRARASGYQAALLGRGVAPDPRWVHHGDARDADFVRGWVRAGRPDAVICGNDQTAAQLIQTLATLGLSVPRDVRVVGVDDLGYAKLLRPPLTTVHQPCQLLARVALHAMLDRLATPSLPPRHIALAGTLVVRQSCGATGSGRGERPTSPPSEVGDPGAGVRPGVPPLPGGSPRRTTDPAAATSARP